MFGQLFIARLKIAVRSKKYMFWTLFFPIALGTLFYFAFNSIYDSTKSRPIPVVIEASDKAVNEYKVMQAFSMLDRDKLSEDMVQYNTLKATAEAMGNEFNEEPPMSEEKLDILNDVDSFDAMTQVPLDTFNKEYLTDDPDKLDMSDLPLVKVLNGLEYENGTKMIEQISCSDHDEADKLLRDGDIAGIITINGLRDINLMVNGEGVNHSILSSIISRYLLQVDLTIDKINENPEESESMEEAIDASTLNLDYIDAKSTGGENKDPFIAYFYNLIAMICIMGSIASLNSVVNAQANQEATGIRIDSSPVNKALLELANLAAVTFIQIILIIITLTYLLYGLKLNFGGDTALIYLTAVLASTVGTSLGFFVGHVGKMKLEIKESILMAFILGGGFLSGLMYGDMKIIIEDSCPLFNRINPSAVISDAFLALNLYGPGIQYYKSIMYILIVDIVMLTVGVILSRKKSYRSL